MRRISAQEYNPNASQSEGSDYCKDLAIKSRLDLGCASDFLDRGRVIDVGRLTGAGQGGMRLRLEQIGGAVLLTSGKTSGFRTPERRKSVGERKFRYSSGAKRHEAEARLLTQRL